MPARDNFIDLDELIVLCRDKSTKDLIREAVACYRAGAYRSCIVATWNAVVFDFLHKLRELEMVGDGNARQVLETFANLQKSHEFRRLWEFERSIPKIAREDFELISPVEESDIARLFEDRSRCAHPSMISMEEPYEATAELARYHLRSAVTHLLQRQPVQGRAASERVLNDIHSAYFPTDLPQAIDYLKSGPLARARPALIRSVVISLTQAFLLGSPTDEERKRQLTGLMAVSDMYPDKVLEVMNDRLSDIVEKVQDENLAWSVHFLARIDRWTILSDSTRLRLQNFVQSISTVQGTAAKHVDKKGLGQLSVAYDVPFLRDSVVTALTAVRNSPTLIFEAWEASRDCSLKAQVILPAIVTNAHSLSLERLVRLSSDEQLVAIEGFRSAFTKQVDEADIVQLITASLGLETLTLRDEIHASIHRKIPSADLYALIKSMHLINDSDYSLPSDLKEELSQATLSSIEKCTLDELDENLPSINLSRVRDAIDERISASLTANLRKYDSGIISRFCRSGTYADSAYYMSLLVMFLADSLTEDQWLEFFQGLFSNRQNHECRATLRYFEELLEKSDTMPALRHGWRHFESDFSPGRQLKPLFTRANHRLSVDLGDMS